MLWFIDNHAPFDQNIVSGMGQNRRRKSPVASRLLCERQWCAVSFGKLKFHLVYDFSSLPLRFVDVVFVHIPRGGDSGKVTEKTFKV